MNQSENELLFCKTEIASLRKELKKYKEKENYSFSLKTIMLLFVIMVFVLYGGSERNKRGNGMLYLP